MSSIPDNNRRDQPDGDPLRIDVIVDQDVMAASIDLHRLRTAAAATAAHRGYDRGEIGIRVTSDEAIRQINREHLSHDYATDVISFSYLDQRPSVEGELVVSWETARRRAAELRWPAESELLLYVVHGTLHITGMDDRDDSQRGQMRRAEQEIMIELGIDDVLRCGVDASCTALEDRA